MTYRIIPRLDIKGPNLVKGIHLEGLRVVGNPEEFARHYYETGADELMYQDVVASLYERNSLTDIIKRTASEIFIPLTVGGGLRTLDDIKAVLRAGADKVALNTAVVARPEMIREASLKFGSSTIVVAIEAIRQPDGSYKAYTDNGREETGLEVVTWAQRVEELGAGEIVITSVDREGTGTGFDLELIQKVAAAVSVPVVAHGGAGSAAHVAEAITTGGASAVAVAGVLHYKYLQEAVFENRGSEGNTVFMDSKRGFNKLKETLTLTELKNYLAERGIPCRMI